MNCIYSKHYQNISLEMLFYSNLTNAVVTRVHSLVKINYMQPLRENVEGGGNLGGRGGEEATI